MSSLRHGLEDGNEVHLWLHEGNPRMDFSENNLINIRKDVNKLYTDVYIGSGKDNFSITTRLAMLENKTEELGKFIYKLGWIVFSTALTVVGAIIGELILRSMK